MSRNQNQGHAGRIVFGGLLLLSVLICGVVQAEDWTPTWSTATMSEASPAWGTSVGSKLLIGGGTLWDIFDTATGSYTTGSLSQQRDGYAVASAADKVFFGGGYNPAPTNLVDIYDSISGTWSTATLSQGRHFLAAASAGGKVLFGGGGTHTSSSGVVDIYNTATGTWSTSALSLARSHLAATSTGSKVFFGGGYTGSMSNVVDIYDTATGTWSTSTLSQARSSLVATSAGGKVFFAGGNLGSSSSNVVDIYNTATGTWSTSPLSQARVGLAATAAGSKVFFAGGRNDQTGEYLDVVDIYDTATGIWSNATLSQGRMLLGAASAGNKVFFGGGYTGPGGGYSSVVDIYTMTQDYGAITSTKAWTLVDQTTVAGRMQLDAPGSLNLSGYDLSASSIGGAAPINLGTGTFTIGADNSSSSYTGPITGNGSIKKMGAGTLTVSAAVIIDSGSSTIEVAGGQMVLGDSSRLDGFRTNGHMAVGANRLTLNSKGFANLGILTTLAGGTLAAPNGISLGVGCNVSGSGTVSAKIATGFGSTIEATGGLALGNPASTSGFYSDGDLYTNANTVTIHDANEAVLGSLTQLGNGVSGGTLTAGTALPSQAYAHFLLEDGKNLEGRGTINGNFKNQGHAKGDGTSLEQRLVFSASWKVSGKGTFENTLIQGIFAPGESPGIVDGTNQGFSGTVAFELGGTTPGFGSGHYDQINDSASILLLTSPTLSIQPYEGFLPHAGDEFTVMTWQGGLDGAFGSVLVDPWFAAQGISFDVAYNNVGGAGNLVLTAVPEPGTLVLLGVGTLGLIGWAWRRRMRLHPLLCMAALVMFVAGSVQAEDWSPLWSTANLSQARGLLAATSAGGKVFFAGGITITGGYSDVVDIYDTATGTWTTATMTQPRNTPSATSAAGKVFFGGGTAGSTAVDIYDTVNGTWSIANLSQARSWLAATSTASKVFFGGGEANGGYSNVVDIYDVSSGVWSTAALSEARSNLEAASAGGKVVFGGGSANSTPYWSSVIDIYEVGSGTWSTANLSQARYYLSAASAGSKVFFGGGYNNISGDSNVVDIYDTATGTWSTAVLSQGRRSLTATSSGSKVFFAGGSGPGSLVDIYDTGSNTWSTSALSQSRSWLASTSEGNKVFFAGGYTSSGRSDVVDIFTVQNYPTITSSKAFALVDETTVAGLMQLNSPGSLSLGSYNLNVGSMSGDAPINLDTRALSVGSDNTDSTYSGVISGAGNLNKTGGGRLTLAEADTFSASGGIAVNQGIMTAPYGISHGGGAIIAATGATLEAGGQVKRAISGAGTVTATDDLLIGSSTQSGQFNLGGAPGVGGTLNVGGYAVAIFSADKAILGSQTNISEGGSLYALHGAQLGNAGSLDATKVLTTTGNATIDGNFINNGLVHGPTSTGQWLTFTQDVTGAGNTTGNISYAGSYSPGNSPAAVSVENLLFDPTSTLTMEIGGLLVGGQYDQLDVSGLATLDGTLSVRLLGGFGLESGHTYRLIAGATSGQFDQVVGLPAGWRVEYAAGGVDVVPEPSMLVLLAVGGLGLVGWTWRRNRASPTVWSTIPRAGTKVVLTLAAVVVFCGNRATADVGSLADANLVAWGYNVGGQCSVPAENNYSEITGGMLHSLALRSDGSLVAWGENSSGECNVPAGNNYIQAAGGIYHSLALRNDGSLAAWGYNLYGECNVPTGNNYIRVASGGYHSLALRSNGSLAAWGYNGYGECNVPAGNNFTQVTGGFYHSVALRSDGSLVAWGYNVGGQCDVPTGNNYVQVFAGGYHSLALRSDGSLVSWGTISYVPPGNNYVQAAAGGAYSLALRNDGTLVAWGSNAYGQCDVPTSGYYLAIASGSDHGVALKARDVYQDLLVTGTGKQALLQRPIDVSGNATVQTTVILQNNPTMTVGGQTLIEGSTSGAGTINSGVFDLRSGMITAQLAGGTVTKNGSGIVTLATQGTYTGDTVVNEGTLRLAQLIGSGLADTADVWITAGAQLDLEFAGTDAIGSLYLDGQEQTRKGTWGAIGSGAQYEDAHFAGPGLLLVTTPEPSTLALVGVGALGLLAVWRRRLQVALGFSIVLVSYTCPAYSETVTVTSFHDNFDTFSLGTIWKASAEGAPDEALTSINDGNRKVLHMLSAATPAAIARYIETVTPISVDPTAVSLTVDTKLQSRNSNWVPISIEFVGSSGNSARWLIFVGNRLLSWDGTLFSHDNLPYQIDDFVYYHTLFTFKQDKIELALTDDTGTSTLFSTNCTEMKLADLGSSFILRMGQCSTPYKTECYIDDIKVTTGVPEPSTLILLGLSGLGLIGWAWKRSPTSRLLTAILAAAAPMLFFSSTAVCATYDAEGQYDYYHNPSTVGGWSYGYRPTLSSPFQLFILQGGPSWFINSPAGPYPNVSLDSFQGVGGLTIASGNLPPTGNNYYGVIRWSAPAAGYYQLDSTFAGVHDEATGTNADVHVYLNDDSLFDSTILRHSSAHLGGTYRLNAGDTLDFCVGPGYDGSSDYDRVFLDARITGVPEPATLALLSLGGLGLLAWACRSRRRVIVGSIVTALLSLTAAAEATDVFNMGGTRNPDGTWTGLASLEMVTVGNPGNTQDTRYGRNYTGNPSDPLGYGGVGYDYQIGKFEVTNAQYCEFLNAKARSDPYALYNTEMGSNVQGGIIRSGSSPNYLYAVKSGYANKPVTYVCWYDTVRFANWLTNDQKDGDTESGS